MTSHLFGARNATDLAVSETWVENVALSRSCATKASPYFVQRLPRCSLEYFSNLPRTLPCDISIDDDKRISTSYGGGTFPNPRKQTTAVFCGWFNEKKHLT